MTAVVTRQRSMTPHLPITIGLYAVLIIGAGIALWGWLQVRSFLASYPSIDSQRDFDEFKRIVKTNMYLALAIMAMSGIAIVLAASAFYLGSLGWTELQMLLFIMGPICTFAGIALTSAENRMKAITLTDDSFRTEFDHVVKRWTSSAFPDW